jgi:uncharacterized protein YfaP (DUF2135 family)
VVVPPQHESTPLAPHAVRVQLAFGAAADLDLYVTGPSGETVYFANTPAAGGALDADRRCGDPAPRIETVAFAAAPAGRYRVGIDFPERCEAGAGEASWRLVFEAPGVREERAGRARFGSFEPGVLEIEVDE